MKPVSMIVILVFALIALGHLLRVIFQTEVLIGGSVIPMWVSVAAVIVAGGLAAWICQAERSGSA